MAKKVRRDRGEGGADWQIVPKNSRCFRSVSLPGIGCRLHPNPSSQPHQLTNAHLTALLARTDEQRTTCPGRKREEMTINSSTRRSNRSNKRKQKHTHTRRPLRGKRKKTLSQSSSRPPLKKRSKHYWYIEVLCLRVCAFPS